MATDIGWDSDDDLLEGFDGRVGEKDEELDEDALLGASDEEVNTDHIADTIAECFDESGHGDSQGDLGDEETDDVVLELDVQEDEEEVLQISDTEAESSHVHHAPPRQQQYPVKSEPQPTYQVYQTPQPEESFVEDDVEEEPSSQAVEEEEEEEESDEEENTGRGRFRSERTDSISLTRGKKREFVNIPDNLELRPEQQAEIETFMNEQQNQRRNRGRGRGRGFRGMRGNRGQMRPPFGNRGPPPPHQFGNQGFPGPQQFGNGGPGPQQFGNGGPPPGNRGPQPGNRGPQPGNRGPQPGNRGPQPGNMGPQPGNMGPQPGNRGPQPGNRAPQPGNRGPQPMLRPQMGNLREIQTIDQPPMHMQGPMNNQVHQQKQMTPGMVPSHQQMSMQPGGQMRPMHQPTPVGQAPVPRAAAPRGSQPRKILINPHFRGPRPAGNQMPVSQQIAGPQVQNFQPPSSQAWQPPNSQATPYSVANPGFPGQPIPQHIVQPNNHQSMQIVSSNQRPIAQPGFQQQQFNQGVIQNQPIRMGHQQPVRHSGGAQFHGNSGPHIAPSQAQPPPHIQQGPRQAWGANQRMGSPPGQFQNQRGMPRNQGPRPQQFPNPPAGVQQWSPSGQLIPVQTHNQQRLKSPTQQPGNQPFRTLSQSNTRNNNIVLVQNDSPYDAPAMQGQRPGRGRGGMVNQGLGRGMPVSNTRTSAMQKIKAAQLLQQKKVQAQKRLSSETMENAPLAKQSRIKPPPALAPAKKPVKLRLGKPQPTPEMEQCLDNDLAVRLQMQKEQRERIKRQKEIRRLMSAHEKQVELGLTDEPFVVPPELVEPEPIQTIQTTMNRGNARGQFAKIRSPQPGHTPVQGQPIPRLGGGTPQMTRTGIQKIEPPSPDLATNPGGGLVGVKRTTHPIAVSPNNKVQKVGHNMRGRGAAQIRPMGHVQQHQNLPQQPGTMMNHPGQPAHIYSQNQFPDQGQNPQLQRQNSRGRGRGRGMNRQFSGGNMQQQQAMHQGQPPTNQAGNVMRGRGGGGGSRGRGLHHQPQQQNYQEVVQGGVENQFEDSYGQVNTGHPSARGQSMKRGRGNQNNMRGHGNIMHGRGGQNNMSQSNVPNQQGGSQVVRGRGRGKTVTGRQAAMPAVGSAPTNKKRTVMMGGQAVQPQQQAGQGDTKNQRRIVMGVGASGGAGQFGGKAVTITNLSSTTNKDYIAGLCKQVGPTVAIQMHPEQRKALVKFTRPLDASTFAKKFNKHLIDLSAINIRVLN